MSNILFQHRALDLIESMELVMHPYEITFVSINHLPQCVYDAARALRMFIIGDQGSLSLNDIILSVHRSDFLLDCSEEYR